MQIATSEFPSLTEAKPQSTPGSLDITLHARNYRARWAQLGNVEQLRVNLRVESGTNGAAKMHVETLDLYSTRSRRVFATRAAQVLGPSVDAIEDDLSELLIAVDHAQRALAMATTSKSVAEPPPVMNDAERAEALKLLRAPDLMDRIACDMSTVGEETNKKLGYLISVSRKLADPLSAIIISQSGAGKSGLASILERAGSDSADYSIRALQSKHKLVQAVPVKDPTTGTIHTRTLEVEGPAAFIETTTLLTINPENASRCFELYLDESAAQTDRVQHAQRAAKTVEAISRRERGRALERTHQNAQRLLDPVAVAIPFAEKLTFPNSWLRTRRDNLRMLNLIEAVAFLHQHQRPRHQLQSGAEYIEATVEDYAIAYSLATTALGFGLDELRKPARDLLALIEGKAKAIAEERGAHLARPRSQSW